MKIIDSKRLCISITWSGKKAVQVKELWEKVKQSNPEITQAEIFLTGLEQALKKHS